MRHSYRDSSRKVAIDLLRELGRWSLWYIGICLVIYAFMAFMPIRTGSYEGNFFDLVAMQSNRAYMLVIGILLVSVILPDYVTQGVTRRDYFRGAVIATALLSLSLTVIVVGLFWVETLIYSLNGWTYIVDNPLYIMFVKHFLHLMFYFLIGWLIGLGFYRYGWMKGLLFIVLSLVLAITIDSLWGTGWGELFTWLLGDLSAPFAVSSLVTVAIIAVTMLINRMLSRTIRIKH